MSQYYSDGFLKYAVPSAPPAGFQFVLRAFNTPVFDQHGENPAIGAVLTPGETYSSDMPFLVYCDFVPDETPVDVTTPREYEQARNNMSIEQIVAATVRLYSAGFNQDQIAHSLDEMSREVDGDDFENEEDYAVEDEFEDTDAQGASPAIPSEAKVAPTSDKSDPEPRHDPSVEPSDEEINP